jgi:hypothetical protein
MTTTSRICTLRWQEILDADGEPTMLTGDCQATIEDFIDAIPCVITFPITGDPSTFDGQLDAALRTSGYKRTSEISCWPAHDGAVHAASEPACAAAQR